MPNSKLTDITFILDRSGSMQSIATDVLGGFNAFVKDQKTVEGDATLSLVQFDHHYDTVYAGRPLSDVPELTSATFVPRGSTALLDAIGRTIVATGARLAELPEAERPGVVIIAIMTDGLENASKEYTREKIFGMIEHQQSTYNWQFVYLGANQDAIATAASFGIARGTTMDFAANGVGVSNVYTSLSASVTRSRGSGAAAFSEEDRKQAMTE